MTFNELDLVFQINPDYSSTFVFDNDFPALLQDVPDPEMEPSSLFQMRPAKGSCRVMCFHPKSNKTLPVMSAKEIEAVIDRWIEEYKDLSRQYVWVQIFENKGASMGCSNPHPHCQIWSCSFLPSHPALKDKHLRAYHLQHKRPLLHDYVKDEIQRKERVVIENEDWLVVVPFWATWPFETMLIARDAATKRISQLGDRQRKNLALVIKELTTKYDNLFNCSFPYSMGWHGAPTPIGAEDDSYEWWTLHAIYYPPLLRSASIRKFMVGFELLAQGQRDLTAEQAAERLRNLDGQKHYSGL